MADTLAEQRFERFARIGWWNQDLLRHARLLVIGAGALGNEIVKNAALLGFGNLVVVDADRIERSNLSRSVLFREADEGRPKAECAARGARELFPGMQVRGLDMRVQALGLGWFRQAHVVLGAVDNREARIFVNSACARVGRPWFDGAIEAFQGLARGFFPPESACYECTMSRRDWEEVARRRSCALVAREAAEQGAVPTTPTTASVVAALQVQEAVKWLHRQPAMLGRGYFFEGLAHGSYGIEYPVKPDCPWHEEPVPLAGTRLGTGNTLREVWDEAARRLGEVTALEFSREILESLECAGCGHTQPISRPLETLAERDVRCRRCGGEGRPTFLHGVQGDSPHLDRTLGELGLPAWDVVFARSGADYLGLELEEATDA